MDAETGKDDLNVRLKVQRKLSSKNTGFKPTLEISSAKKAIPGRRILRSGTEAAVFAGSIYF
jgi:hypothetical protein